MTAQVHDDDTQPGNPNNDLKLALFGITQVQGRVRGGLSVTVVIFNQLLNLFQGQAITLLAIC
jgi:hypothetical protein